MICEGNESSSFGQQLKDFPCLYVNRVSNFLHYLSDYYYQSRSNTCRTTFR